MVSAAALRQRRYRAHAKGDHSLCPPGRPDCRGDVTPAATGDVTPDASPAPAASAVELGRRGRRLWRTVTAEQTPTPVEAVLLEEACRIADRLDRLDDVLRGEEREWLRLRIPNNGDGSTVRVIVTGVLSEARQQAVALKQIVADLRQAKAAPEKPKPEASRRDELARKRAERRAAAGL